MGPTLPLYGSMKRLGNPNIAATASLVLAATLALPPAASLAQSTAAPTSAPTVPGDGIRIELSAGGLSVQANGIALGELLVEIARQADLTLEIDGGVETWKAVQGSLAEIVTVSYQGLTLAEVIEELLSGHSYLLRAADSGGPGGYLWLSLPETRTDREPLHSPTEGRASAEETERLETLLERLTDPDHRKRVRAVLALGEFDAERATTAVAVAAQSDLHASVRSEAAYALGQIGDETARAALSQVLLDPEHRVREAAVAAFVDIGDEESAWALAPMLADLEPSVREEAVYALAAIGGTTATSLLESALSDQDDEVVDAARDVLEDRSER